MTPMARIAADNTAIWRLPYDDRFVMGHSLAESADTVKLNHPHCARFCVLGGGSCSRGA